MNPIDGTFLGDLIRGTDEDDEIRGGGGGDTILGKDGDDNVRGQFDDDTLFGDDGEDLVQGGDDNDRITGGSGGNDGFHDILLAGDGNDALYFSGEDQYDGGSGADTFRAEALRALSPNDNGPVFIIEAPLDQGVRIDMEAGVAVLRGTGAATEDFYLPGGPGIGTGQAEFISIEQYDLTGFGDYFAADNTADEIFGLGGSDILEGRGGGDAIDGGTGSDTIEYGSAGTSVNVDLERGTGLIGDAEGDTYTSIENIRGTRFVDALYGNDGINTIFGREGNDFLEGRGQGDTLDGGDGEDTALYDSSPGGVDVALFRAGAQSFGDAAGDILRDIENVTGSDFGDTLTGSDEANELSGGNGDDTVDGGLGDDVLIGSAGIDTASFERWDQAVAPGFEIIVIDLGEGNELGTATRSTINFATLTTVVLENNDLYGFENVRGSNRGEVMIGNNAVNVFEGRGGADTFQGNLGSDTFVGGAGSDTASYEDNPGRVFVALGINGADGSASETITVNNQLITLSTDTLRGIENVRGSAFADIITGNGADNTLDGRGGTDTMSGGGGDDTYIVDNAGDFASEANQQGIDRVRTSVTYALAAGSEIEFLETTNQLQTVALTLVGNGIANTITGNNGANIVVGGGGPDSMIGLRGDDIYIVDNVGDSITEAGTEGTDEARASVSYTLTAGADVETLRTTDDNGTAALNLTGNGANNLVVGNNGDNRLEGGGGNSDELQGRGGNDTYIVRNANVTITEAGGQGIDTVQASVSYRLTAGADVEELRTTQDTGTEAIDLTGNGAGNVVTGNDGSNVLNGGGGNDTLTGRGGADDFRFDTALDAAFNVAQITDFIVGVDTIVLDNAVFTAFKADGAVAADRFFVVGTAVQDANDNIVYDRNAGNLFYDSDGAGGAAPIRFATVTPGLNLSAADFFIV
jgi:Ca2+-binding RTX toxin-like protein